MSHTVPLATFQAACDAWRDTKAQSVERWEAMMADAIDFRTLGGGRGPLPADGAIQTKHEAVEFLRMLSTDMTMTSFNITQYVTDERTIAAIGDMSWKVHATGKEFCSPIVAIWRFENGKAIAYCEFYDTAKAVAALTP